MMKLETILEYPVLSRNSPRPKEMHILTKLGFPEGADTVSGLRVLVAEDEPGLRELITDVLTQRGHMVVTVASGDAAAESLATAPARPQRP